jgi:alpha-N-acetylglucosamine transferase
MKIAALIYFWGPRYQGLGQCALDSFTKYHPDIDLYTCENIDENDYNAVKYKSKVKPSAYRYLLAANIMTVHKYDKIIILGGDTITCSRLDEFLDDNEHDMLVTLDYPYQLVTPRVKSPDSETHLNIDVICFNKVAPLLDIVNLAGFHDIYNDQGALNEIIWSDKHNYSYKIVDGPYENSDVVYNARAKGNIVAGPGQKPWGKYTNKFYVKDKKLFTGDDKQIKVWHYCDGFGTLNNSEFEDLMNNWISDWFNEETKKFFKEQSDCGDFFEKEFKVLRKPPIRVHYIK